MSELTESAVYAQLEQNFASLAEGLDILLRAFRETLQAQPDSLDHRTVVQTGMYQNLCERDPQVLAALLTIAVNRLDRYAGGDR